MDTVTIGGKLCKKAIIQGIPRDSYYVDPDGNIWSGKTKYWKKLTPHISENATRGYAKSAIKVNGKMISFYFHKVVCATLVPFPRPEGITKKDWDATPETVKEHMKAMYIVNHIDHDRTNYHPSNLEWVTSQGNAMAYQRHKSLA